MKKLIAATAMLAFTLTAVPVVAQDSSVIGEVRKIDESAGKITLKHGEIKNLDMPPMSMAFAVKDPALLGKVKVGDKVRFAADKIDGTYTVTAIEVAR